MENFKILSKNKLNNLPKTPGVYAFFEHTKIIYIGKAINIQSRVKNHFTQPSYRDNLFISKVSKIGFLETNSEIEALILEANLIKKQLPRFNVVWRDDKNYFYIAIEKNQNKIPFIFITHQKSRLDGEYIGPFVEGNALKKALKYLRKVFPFYTSAKHPHLKCTWCHLGLCPGPNPNIVEYKKNIKKLALVLKGKRNNVLSSLKKEMKLLSLSQKFEEAAKIRNQIFALEQVLENTRVIDSEKQETGNNWDETQRALQKILSVTQELNRIECYDISNIQGKQATGSMVVFSKGQPDTNEYRKFRIQMKQEPNDIAMLKEIFTRRFHNAQWPSADIMLIDGGKAQLNAAIEIKKQHKKKIKIISIAKGRQELFIEGEKDPIPLKKLPQSIYNLIKHLDDEAHRFAITYHKEIRKRELLR